MPKTEKKKKPSAEGLREERDRKERVLHTRISDKLADNILRAAEDLRVPVSNLVRNVLEDTFSVVEQVTGNVSELIDNVLDEADRAGEKIQRQIQRGKRVVRDIKESGAAAKPPSDSPADIIGWQTLRLNNPQKCSSCETQLARGAEAVVGMTTSGLSRTFLCTSCLEAGKF